jgi:hypothetical protein
MLPFIPDKVDVKLYYQTTSKEYVEFLRDANTTNNAGNTIYNLWVSNGKCPPELMSSQSWSRVTHWTGAVSQFWNASGNWDNEIPTSDMNAVIPASPVNQPFISASTACNNLIIESGAELIITNNSTLTVHGDVVFKGTQTSTGSISNMRNINYVK